MADTTTLTLPQAGMQEVYHHLKVFVRRKSTGKAVVTFDGTCAHFATPEMDIGAPAEGNWPGQARVGMAALMAMGVLGTWLAPPALHDATPPLTLQEAVVEPFREFMGRRGAWEVLAFAVLYKLGDMLAQALPTLFYLDVGFSLTQIGTITKFVGTGAIIAGMAAGGAFMLRITMKRALLLFGILQGASSLAYLWLAHAGPKLSLLALTVSLENLCYGLGLAALMSFLMGQCHHKYTATQFALLSSLTALTRTVLAAPAGSLVKHWGWSSYFLFCTVMAVPGLLMLMRFDRWAKPETEEAAG